MRSQDHTFRLADNTPLEEFDTTIAVKWLIVKPDGTFITRNGFDDTERSYHLDSNAGFQRFTEILLESGKREKAKEIRNSLYIHGSF